MKLKLRNRSSRSSPDRSRRMDDPSAFVVKELIATFKVFDKDGDGKISKSELGVVLRSLGDDLNDAELDDVVQRLGDSDGCINLQQFVSFHTDSAAWTSPSSSASDSAHEISHLDTDLDALKNAFDVFDIDKNGFICAEELQTVMSTLGDKHTSLAECRHMINCVDKDGNAMVDFREFQGLMSSTSVLSFPSKRRAFAGL